MAGPRLGKEQHGQGGHRVFASEASARLLVSQGMTKLIAQQLYWGFHEGGGANVDHSLVESSTIMRTHKGPLPFLDNVISSLKAIPHSFTGKSQAYNAAHSSVASWECTPGGGLRDCKGLGFGVRFKGLGFGGLGFRLKEAKPYKRHTPSNPEP